MSDRWKDTILLLLVVIGIIAIIMAILLNLSLFLTVLLVIIAIVVLVFAALVVLGLVAAIPYYFAKHGKESEPGSYDLEKVKPVKEDEKK
jgi:membrane protein implicated in regulation of membrane protease activity